MPHIVPTPHHRRTPARRKVRIGAASFLAALAVPVASARHASAAGASTSPTDTTMWEIFENATINTDASPAANQVVRLTPAQTYKKGYAVYKPIVPASNGVDITFMFAEWGGSGNDGISFFAKDARDTTNSFGAVGHPLGYGTRSGTDGLSSALLGIGFGAGFDAADVDGTGCSYSTTPTRISNSNSNRGQTVTLRGGPGYDSAGGTSNNRRSNYCLLADPTTVQAIAPFNNSYSSRVAAARAARITIDPLTDATPRIKVYYGETTATMTMLFDVPAPSNLTGVDNLKIGFSGATGAGTNNHEIWGLTSATETYEITFDGQGGTLSTTSASYTKTSSSDPLALPTVTPRDGYDFLGWYTESTGGTQVAGPTDSTFTPTNPGTLYARWAARHTVSFDANGGTGTATPQTSSSATTLPANPFTREGYTFAGWSTSPTGSVVYADGASYPFTTTETLYAVWTSGAGVTTTTVAGIDSSTTVSPSSDDAELPKNGNWATNLATIALLLVLAGAVFLRTQDDLSEA